MLKKKVLFIVMVMGVLLLAGITAVSFAQTIMDTAPTQAVNDPSSEPDTHCATVLEPIQPGETESKVVQTTCGIEEAAAAEMEMLEPMNPQDFVPADPEWADQGEMVNGIVEGVSEETAYRCVVFLEPMQSGEQSSKASEPVCAKGVIDSVDGVSLASSFLVARFYDNTNYGSLLQEYYGPTACSATTSYGVNALPSSLDNKFESGRSYSNCDHISVFDFVNHTGATYACGANCSSFYALNNAVTSWKVTD